MWRQVITQVTRCAHAAVGAGLAQLADFADKRVNLLLLPDDNLVELIQQIFGEAGLDLQFHQALVGCVCVFHPSIGPERDNHPHEHY